MSRNPIPRLAMKLIIPIAEVRGSTNFWITPHDRCMRQSQKPTNVFHERNVVHACPLMWTKNNGGRIWNKGIAISALFFFHWNYFYCVIMHLLLNFKWKSFRFVMLSTPGLILRNPYAPVLTVSRALALPVLPAMIFIQSKLEWRKTLR